MKNLFTAIFALLTTISAFNNATAQCAISNSGSSTLAQTCSYVAGQSFKATCTGKLSTIVYAVGNMADDFRNTGYFVSCRIKDASGNVLANGFTSTGALTTDQWYPGTSVTFDFSCSNLTMNANTTYIWELIPLLGTGPTNMCVYFLNNSTTSSYADGTLISDGVADANKDYQGWTVNIATSVTGLSATQTQTNPTSSTATNGSASVAVSGGITSATTTYVWKKNGTVISGATGSSITNQGVGTYTCDITKGCTITKTFTLTAGSLGTNETDNYKFNLYPNPANTEIHFTVSEIEKVEIYSIDGKLVKSLEAKKGNNKINVSNLSAGNYILKTKTGTQKFIKK